MKKGNSRYRFKGILLAGIAVCAFASISCHKTDESRRFSDSLARIDVLTSTGDSVKALKNLSNLRKSATSVSQWLSIAKRERDLDAGSAALVTLAEGLHRIPSSAELAAVMADTLIRRGDYERAIDYASSLAGSPYEILVSYAEIKRSANADFSSIAPKSWLSAATATGLPVFRRNAAVAEAMKGNLSVACSVAVGPIDVVGVADAADVVYAPDVIDTPDALFLSDEELFRSILFYDAGFDEKVLERGSSGDEWATGSEMLSLMADAAWNLKNTDLARAIWERNILSHPAETALSYYNLAVTENDPVREKMRLEDLFALFPAYYPAVVRFVRSVPENPPEPVFDSLETELEQSGFRTLEMQRRLDSSPVSREAARRVLRNAISRSESTPDIRFVVEDFRMDWYETPDTVKTRSAMWRLLEQYPDDPVLHSWSLWFFMSIRDLETSFSLNGGSTEGDGAFYTGLECALSGDLDRAEELLATVANSDGNAWCALADIGRIRERKNDPSGAAESFSVAAGLAPDARTASALHYEAARVLAGQHSVERAISILGYALDLYPGNYRADLLLRELEASK